MKRSNSAANNSDWVRLNVGGKVFQTTKSTLSTHPESFLARLANGNIPSEKDESGAFLIDRNYEHFGTILNYFRSGVVNLDRNEKAMKDLLCEADFYNVQSLVNVIHKAMGTVSKPNGKRIEIIVVRKLESSEYVSDDFCYTSINMSERQAGYEVLRALRQKVEVHKSAGIHYVPNKFEANWTSIEAVLRSYGFVEEFNDSSLAKGSRKFVRSV
ncbi:BTB/POZ domain-containing protein [Ditylenchus destructor]|nr:BTB/POZ domain-containing protein [Ditylenchus destructor]